MTADSEALCVRVLWFDVRVATHVLRKGASLALNSLGELTQPGHAPMRFDSKTLTFHDGLTGTLLRNGETALSLSDSVARGLAVEAQGAWELELGRSDILQLGSGPVRVEAFRLRAPTRPATAFNPDYGFLNSLLACAAVFFLFAASAELSRDLDDDDVPQVSSTKLRRILVQSEPPPPPKKHTGETSDTPRPTRRVASEGTPRPPSRPQRDTGGVNVAALTGRLFGGLGASGVFGPGGLGKELSGALGGVVAVNATGNGGWSLRGDGAGGPHDGTIQIGGIARSGVDKRSGIGELCAGPGPCKKSIGPDLPTDPPVECGGGGCMDKELIRKVIAGHRDQIRYCYEYALQTTPALGGKVAVQFFVTEAGSVSTARVAESTVGSNQLSDCLVSRVRTWQFPVGKNASGYRVTYPFLFKRAG